ncbi:Protein of unknown function [Gryllus bimaculatus]|nr:Protein of unknown function [Gryllus bimaculatus]
MSHLGFIIVVRTRQTEGERVRRTSTKENLTGTRQVCEDGRPLSGARYRHRPSTSVPVGKRQGYHEKKCTGKPGDFNVESGYAGTIDSPIQRPMSAGSTEKRLVVPALPLGRTGDRPGPRDLWGGYVSALPLP